MRAALFVPVVLAFILGATGCGGPDQATLESIAAAESRLDAGVARLEHGEFVAVATDWTACDQLLRQHAEVETGGVSARARLAGAAQRYRTTLDAHAAEWMAATAGDPAAGASLLTLARAVEAQQILKLQAERDAAVVVERERAAAQAAEAQRTAQLMQLPGSVLVKVRLSPDLPREIARQIDQLTQPAIDQLTQHLAGIPVIRAGKDLPPGAASLAAGVIELLVTSEYVTYSSSRSMGMEALDGLDGGVPTTLAVRLLSRRGLSLDLALDASLTATKPAPDSVKGTATQLAEQQSKTLIAEIVAGYAAKLPTWDVARLQAAIASHPLDVAKVPLIAVEMKGHVGKGKDSDQMIAATGSDALQSDLLEVLARRLAPVRLTLAAAPAADGHLLVDTTMWFEMYGRKEGGLVINNGSLPYRAAVVATLEDCGAARNPWAGVHRYQALVDLPEQVSRSGGFMGEALHSVAQMTEQFTQQIDAELAAVHAYQPGQPGEVDQYLLRIVPVGRFADEPLSSKLATFGWYKALPQLLAKGLAAQMAPAQLITTVAQVRPRRLAGTIEVHADGTLMGFQPIGSKVMDYRPDTLALELNISSAFSGRPHVWEGAHPLALKLDSTTIMQAEARKKPDPVGTELSRQLGLALK